MMTIIYRLAGLIGIFFLSGLGMRWSGLEAATVQEQTRPNFLIVMTDDQRYDTVGEFMPEVQSRIFDQGLNFVNGYATTPVCCPSRASVLTGMYAYHHGVTTNDIPLRHRTFMDFLHDAGYYTGVVGKYLNSWNGMPRPEVEYWVSFDSGDSGGYFGQRLNVNGQWTRFPDSAYSTYVFRDYALDFLERSMAQNRPFALLLGFKSPHEPAEPAPGDESLYPNLPPHRPPNYNEPDIADKPLWIQQRPLISPAKAEHIDQFRRAQLQTLRSTDRAIGAILDWLEEQGILDETVVFFLSDNGYFWGEHRLTLKNLPYQEGARVPFAMRYPPLIPQGRIETRLVANIDIAPTIYKLAGISPPLDLDGRSIVRLLEAPQEWRTDLLIEGWPNGRTFRAVHTGDLVYIETDGDRNELYDMRLDPYQLENRAEDPAYRQILTRMQNRLARLRGQ